MKIIQITAEMIDDDFFDRFEGVTIGVNEDIEANSKYFIREVDGEDTDICVTVYTKYVNMQSVKDLVEDGDDDAFTIYEDCAYVVDKWEVEATNCNYNVELTQEAIEKLDEIHDKWESCQDEYTRDRINDIIDIYNKHN
jgi:phosphoenolpyruvate-protein kinase (PTS system EI component)